MNRVCEPELMDNPEQALAYARADFSRENQYFVDEFCTRFPDLRSGHIVDLGCGPADIPIRLLRARRDLAVTAIDASLPMIELAHAAIDEAGLKDSITVHHQSIRDVTIPYSADAIISNSLLHHLPDPLELWTSAKRRAKSGAPILVMDLLRTESTSAAHALVDQYAHDAPAILKRDFYNSLLAAFTLDEVSAQLTASKLDMLSLFRPDDLHWVASGQLPSW